MQPAAQAAIVAGGALAVYLMAKLTPNSQTTMTHDHSTQHPDASVVDAKMDENPLSLQQSQQNDEIDILEPIATEIESSYSPAPSSLAWQGIDLDLIQMITKETLSSELANSTENAKKKALEIGKFGFPSYSNLRFYDSYCSSINYCTKCPNWSGELLSKQDLEINEEVDRSKCPPFSECEGVPEKFRSSLIDYKRSGFSRGHLAPAGDHNSIQLNKDLTFKLSTNIVPQEMSMNGCDWLRIERFVKRLIISNDNDIEKCWVFSGPVFKPKFRSSDGERMYSKPVYVKKTYEEGEEDKGEMEKVIKTFNAPKDDIQDGRMKGKMRFDTIGKTMVHVPTHMYKVVLAERGKNKDMSDMSDTSDDEKDLYQLAAFMVENGPIHDILPLTDYLIDIDELESYVGLQFFPRLRYNKDVENVIKYGELCKNYNCEYDDDERSGGWRCLAIIKSAMDLEELETVWKQTCDRGFEKDWMKSMFGRAYYYRKKDLLRPIQKRINYFRQFQ